MFWSLFVLIAGFARLLQSEFVPKSPGDPFDDSPDRDSPLSGVSSPHDLGLPCDGITNISRCRGCDILRCVEGSTEMRHDACGVGTHCGCPYEALYGCEAAMCLPGNCTAVDLDRPKEGQVWYRNKTHMLRWHLDSREPLYTLPPGIQLMMYLDDGHGGPFHLISNKTWDKNWHTWNVDIDVPPGKYRISIQGSDDKDVYDMHYPVHIKNAAVITPGDSAESVSLKTIIYVIAAVAGIVFVIGLAYSYLTRKLSPDYWTDENSQSSVFRKVSDWSGSHRTIRGSKYSTRFDSIDSADERESPLLTSQQKQAATKSKKNETSDTLRHKDVEQYLALPSRMSTESFDPVTGRDYEKFMKFRKKSASTQQENVGEGEESPAESLKSLEFQI